MVRAQEMKEVTFRALNNRFAPDLVQARGDAFLWFVGISKHYLGWLDLSNFHCSYNLKIREYSS